MTLYQLGDIAEETSGIINAAIEVHRHLGPGLLESAYQVSLSHELRSRGQAIETQVPVFLTYKGIPLSCAYRLDLLVNKQVIVEVKAVSEISPIHQAQMLTYLRLTGCEAGLILNFNVTVLKDGIRRVLNTRQKRG